MHTHSTNSHCCICENLPKWLEGLRFGPQPLQQHTCSACILYLRISICQQPSNGDGLSHLPTITAVLDVQTGCLLDWLTSPLAPAAVCTAARICPDRDNKGFTNGVKIAEHSGRCLLSSASRLYR